mgnify:CR=1 FL=1
MRGIGLVVTAEWPFGAPGAVPATETAFLMGVPVLVGAAEAAGAAEEGARSAPENAATPPARRARGGRRPKCAS